MSGEIDEFPSFPKIPRLFRSCIITEKLDGTNGLIRISEDGSVRAGSRSRWLTPGKDDNYGFAQWVFEHQAELLALGPGNHYGEWWGRGIQRNYGLSERRFSLFNVRRYRDPSVPGDWFGLSVDENTKQPVHRIDIPACVHLVPILARGIFSDELVRECLDLLRRIGSRASVPGKPPAVAAVPEFMKPEGVVVYHEVANRSFKVLCENDDVRKG